MSKISEEQLEEAWQHIESAVFIMLEGSDVMVNKKYELVEDFFSKILDKSSIEVVE